MKINFKSTLLIMNLLMMITIDLPVECGLISKRSYQDTLPEMDQQEALENKAESEANLSNEPNADDLETLETTSINESSEDHVQTQVDQIKSEETTLFNLIESSTAETTLSITESPISESIEASLSTLANLLDQSTAQETTSETEYSTSQPLLLENTEKEDSIVQNNETAVFQPSLVGETEQSVENNPVITDTITELVNTTEESILENTKLDQDSNNETTPDQTKDISVHETNVTQESVAQTESSATQSILTETTNETYKEKTEPENSSLVTENENLIEAATEAPTIAVTETLAESVTETTPEAVTETTPEAVTETTPESVTETTPESVTETTPEAVPEMTITRDQLETTTTELSIEDTSEATTEEAVNETTTELLKTATTETEKETESTTEIPLATKYIWKKPDPYENDKIMNEETKLTANCPSLNCEFGYKTDLFGKVLCSCFNPCLENKCGPNRVCQIKKVADDKFLGLCFDPAKVERPVKCHLPLAPGKCKDPSLKNYSSRFYFDSFHQTCKHFIYTGCNGNANNFENWEKCQMECNTCSLPPVKGPCKASIIRYYYDQINQSCVPFSFGGCKGNENNFASKKQCEESCLIRKEGALFLHGLSIEKIKKYYKKQTRRNESVKVSI